MIFAVVLICTYAIGYNLLASYNLQSAFSGFSFYSSATPIIIGAILAVLFAVCILGGAKRLTNITGVLVPVMGVIYILVAIIVVVINIKHVPGVFANIFAGAFLTQNGQRYVALTGTLQQLQLPEHFPVVGDDLTPGELPQGCPQLKRASGYITIILDPHDQKNKPISSANAS